ncbi:cytochrome P450 [Hypoxylon trugodes]|uniref:cytochrome P450 n=1 Tax=Hypoxylon trugodes TaxID=326681 RepID=UPI00219D2F51|nr:cytochrome P450 [Hypoxylon trugodes]KAI1388756.1 cytochrome P450 [Hypoxylon trugodes]
MSSPSATLYLAASICYTSIQLLNSQVLSDVVRVAPNEIVFSTPRAVQDIYNSVVKGQETSVKTDLMDFGTGDLGLTWETDPVKRRDVARKVFPAFSSKAIKAKEPTVQMYIDLFVDKMRELGDTTDGIDLYEWTNWFAADMSADLTYSRELHQMRDGKYTEFLETLLGTSFLGTVMQVSKRFPLLSPLSILFVPPKVLRTLPTFFKMNSQEVQKRIDKRGDTVHPDFVDYMLPLDVPAPTTKKEKIHLEQVTMQLFLAGFDPVQIVLFSAVFFLLKTPDAYTALVEEIRDTFRDYNDITPDTLIHVKYLNAVIHETLRTHVTTISGMPRRSPGATVASVYVPKGVICQVSNFNICRNPRYFHDPLNFHPERWLPPDHPRYDTKFSKDDLKCYLPFSIGPRLCTGREIAWSQIRLFLAKMLWTFDLEMIRGQDKTFDKDFWVHAIWHRPEVRVRFLHRYRTG